MTAVKNDAVWRVIRNGLRLAQANDRTRELTVFIDQWEFDQAGVLEDEAARAMGELKSSGLLVCHSLYTVGGDCWRIEVNADYRRIIENRGSGSENVAVLA